MSKWLWAAVLALQAHFGPHTSRRPNHTWEYSITFGRGLFGAHPNLLGIALGGVAGIVSALAALAIVGIWVPHDWWRSLAIVGAVLELVVMIGFFGPTKLLPIALDLAVFAAVVIERLPVREAL